MSVRVRFAPSPTGFVHIGSLRTALYNYLYAKKNGGKYILRVEDTDQNRYVEGAIENMLGAMSWAKVEHDEGVVISEDGHLVQRGDFGPYIQSERLSIYKEYIEKLIEKRHAYYCFCSKERIDQVREEQKSQGLTQRYDGFCRSLSKEEVQAKIGNGESYVVRLKLPENKDIAFDDVIRGNVVVNTSDMDDQVLIKSDGFPTYHFAVVVDDHLMGITHVIRGEEWLISTPKHVYTFEAFGWEAPKYAHLPNILNSDKKKLSKRQGDVAVEDFMQKGYLPEALVNYIALLGWSPEDNQEIFSLEELEQKFSLDRVSKAGGVFDINKLNWVNSHYIKEKPLEKITDLSIPYLVKSGYVKEEEIESKYDWIKDIVSVLRVNLNNLSEISEKVDLFFNAEFQLEDAEAVQVLEDEQVPQLISVFINKIEKLDIIDEDSVKSLLKEIQKETGLKGPKLFKPIRVAVTGKAHGPDLPLVMKILGKQNILSRINYVLNNLIS
ncbi:glutamate--tRNA ligase [Serpentinicella alkaliphila]|uniref:Glutamate--tRNA ligase n=1 Tax=Serpentinicella alkaliphila TaxID=1734049 RepID=A0A4R2TEX6_9FIRM|nr:glutamate--tRNA ligase [Serpentinicella alkaliphila]QUH25415.1 glutamate--tRNA ligase [Serpentinicella alkaliphila]TCQ00622.1 nondiscriminating glutamyl-tRNA synthetase [Serpentinicella alkaliphila]